MHHAYLLVGEFEECLTAIATEDRTAGADVQILLQETFGISDARTLKEQTYEKPVERPYRVFVLALLTITVEAQNALLKLFEDPAPQVKFYVIIGNEDILLPTLRSRLMSVSVQKKEQLIDEPTAYFLKSTYKDRLAVIAERMKEKDIEWADRLCRGVEIWIERNNETTVLRDLIFVRRYDRERGASKKMLLEHLALSLPIVKKMG